MIAAQLPGNECERIRAIRRYRVLDTAPEEPFDRICRIAARSFGVPIALIGVVDDHREWFKAAYGWPLAERDRGGSFGAHAIREEGPLVVLDAGRDSRFRDNLAVTGPPHVAFYAGAPLLTPEGFGIGVLAVVDTVPRARFDARDRALLADLAASVMDLLERRRHSEPRYRRMVENSPDAILLHDGQTVTYANRRAAELFGGDPRGRAPLALLDPARVETARPRLEAVLKGKRTAPLETRIARLDGTFADVEENAVPVSVGVVEWVLRDISERKLRETARSLAELGWWKRDLITGEVQCSEEAYRILGVPAGTPPAAAGFRESAQPARRHIVRPDGETRTIVERSHIQYDRSGQPAAIVGTVQDVTDIKQLEERLWQAQKMEAVGRLAGGVAHDFNNLLTVIMGYCQLLLRHLAEQSPLREYGDEILRAAERASALTGQLLAFSRRQAARSTVVELHKLVHNMQEMLRRILGEDVTLSADLAAAPGSVDADPSQVEQMLMNLAINARESMPGGGQMVIATANAVVDPDSALQFDTQLAPGRYVRLSVGDTGGGMTPEQQAHAFDPFFTPAEGGRSTGLALSAVYGMAAQSGGGVRVTSQPGKGSTFEIYLPEAHGETQAAPSAPRVERSTGSEVVLLVEDEPGVRLLASHVLRGAGYQVLEAEGFRAALDTSAAFEGSIHLMITDVIMPEGGGPQLVDAIRSVRPATRFLYMSGYGAEVDRQRLERDGAAFIPKPFAPDALLTAVRAALGGSSRAGSVLIADDERGVRSAFRAILEDAGYRVTEAGNGREALDLLRRERFDLLITDIAMPGQAGLETIHELRAGGIDCGIIAVSGAFGGSLLEFATRLGAERVLPKPVAREILLGAVADVLGGAGRNSQSN